MPVSADLLDPAALMALAAREHDGYVDAEPFPHAVLDGVIPDATLEGVLGEFPDPAAIPWQSQQTAHERKLASADELSWGPVTRELMHELNAAPFVGFLEQLTGILGLIPDPHFAGGGLHQIERGGYLKVHADFSRHHYLQLDRRLNVLVYLNHDWDASWGGHLELWDREMRHPVRKVEPSFGRTVVFSTTDIAYHGHPEPLDCPPDRRRRSLALYYYTAGRPEGEAVESHTTRWVDRPDETRRRRRSRRELVRWLTPPAVFDGLHAARARLQR